MKKPTKIIMNKENEILSDKLGYKISVDLIDLLSKDIDELILNDDGGNFKDRLKEFDISKDKEFGNDWHFTFNEKSEDLIKEVLKYYFDKQWGYLKWSLVGKNFKIDYTETGAEISYPEYNEEDIQDLFKITAEGENLDRIKKIFD